MSFKTLGLEPRLLTGVSQMGYADPTPIQREAIPHILQGTDVVGVAQTGTGKTAAFVLPMLQRTPTRRGVRALIITPTRELALQISQVVHGISRQTGHRSAVVYGGVGLQQQIDKLRRGVDVVIACPGRLLDLHSRRAVDLSKVEMLVLDEADRMLDMGFWPDVRRILGLLPEKRQNLLFSATMSREVLKIVESTLHEPVRVEVSPPSTPVDRIEQSLYPVCSTQKTDLLVSLLKRNDHTRALIFTRTKHRAERLSKQLENKGVASAAIHGGRTQGQRQRALEAFRAGRSPVLVATDVVSRGIDVDDVTHVINYDMPNTPEDYVHRIGRTARAGASGTAISFLSSEELSMLSAIERTLGSTLACEDLEGFVYSPRQVPAADRGIKGAAMVWQGSRQRTRAGRRGGSGRVAGRMR